MKLQTLCKRQTNWLLFGLLLLLPSVRLLGQMEVKDVTTPPFTAQSLIYDELLGEGVQITNVVYEGTDNSVGFFSNAGESIGIESGILLTTGAVSTVGANVGVEQVGSVQASVDNGSVVQDADMTTLADFSLFNISKYTITFIPSSDSISFRYVFASEEYPEFVCSDYNDIFGFFISGPGINGPYENNAENIALIPGTDLPVKINNVNGGIVGSEGVISNCQGGNGYLDFSEFYVDNDGSSQQPVFDGFLQVFTATAKVIPCSTYTIKIVVADQGDPQRDSGVFLEAKSFSSEFISANVLTESIDGTIIEGCTDAVIEINIPTPAVTDINLNINVFGTATEGTDFNNFPPITIPAGQTSTSINVAALEDGVAEGLENLFFDIQLNQCFKDTFSFLINDNLIPTIDLGRDTSVCSGTTLSLNVPDLTSSTPSSSVFSAENVNVPIISPPPGASPMEIKVPLEVSGISPLELRAGLIQSVCINIDHNRLEDLAIYLEAPNGRLLALSTNNGATNANYTNTCFTVDAMTSIRDGVAPFTGTFLPEGNWERLWSDNSPLNGTWNLVVIDEAFGFNGIIEGWSITFNSVVNYTYTWENADDLSCTDCLTPIVTATTSKDYILNVQDNYGCISTDTLSVTIFENVEAAPVITCTEQTFDAIAFEWNTVEGSIAYEVNINNMGWAVIPVDQTNYRVENLSLDETVNFAVRAVGGCNSMEANTSCTTLNCTPIILADQTIQNLSCTDATDGQIRITAMGSNGPFQYELNGTNNSDGLFENLGAGDFTILITDALNCSNSFDFTITAPEALVLTPITIADIGCNGEAGSATVGITGGTAPYAFNWDSGATDSIITNMDGGDFMVTVTDANSCENTALVSIAPKTPISITFDTTATCQGATDGSAMVNITGGLLPYQVVWDAVANNQIGETATNLAAGTYEITITDANDCSIIGMTTIEEIPTIEAPQVSCGTVTSDAITFIWSPIPNTDAYEVNVENSGWVNASDSLSHTVSGLSLDQMINIEVRGIGMCSPLIGTMSCTTIDCSVIEISSNVTNPLCQGQNDGIISLAATGDNPPFQYELNGESNTFGLFENLPQGNYVVNITDNIGCITSISIAVTSPDALQASTTVLQEETCDQSGKATLDIIGGTGPYEVEWSNGVLDSLTVDLAAGDYRAMISDANGCMADAMVTINPYIEMTATVTTVDNSCTEPPTGSATVTVQGGNPSYTYLWDDMSNQTTSEASNLIAGNYNVIITDANNCSITAMGVVGSPSSVSIDSISSTAVSCANGTDGQATAFISGGTGQLNFIWDNNQTTQTANDLSSGTYTLTVNDEAGCATTATVTITEPDILTLSASTPTISCPEDLVMLDLTVNGGTGMYTYQWSTGAITEDLQDIIAGNYTVTVTDVNNCIATLTRDIQPAIPFSLSLNTTPIKCADEADGSIQAVLDGGVNPFTYQWSTGANSPILNNLSAGNYSITITDAAGCTVSGTDSLIAPPALALSTELTQPLCSADLGSILVTPSGGTGPYEIMLNNVNYGEQVQFDNLQSGDYNLVLVDANNCSQSSENLQISTIPPIAVSLESDIVVFLGDSLVLTPEITNGVAPFDYFWDASSMNSISCQNCASPTIKPLQTTDYTLEVIDANGCIANTSISARVNKERKIYAPNAFSPNQDGINDRFMIFGKKSGIIKELMVFDRWGNLIFKDTNMELNNELRGWDGTFKGRTLKPSVFAWMAQIEFIDGESEIFKGEINLIR